MGPAVTGVSERTKFEVDCGASKLSRNCGRPVDFDVKYCIKNETR
jgi:hypothetical protein